MASYFQAGLSALNLGKNFLVSQEEPYSNTKQKLEIVDTLITVARGFFSPDYKLSFVPFRVKLAPPGVLENMKRTVNGEGREELPLLLWAFCTGVAMHGNNSVMNEIFCYAIKELEQLHIRHYGKESIVSEESEIMQEESTGTFSKVLSISAHKACLEAATSLNFAKLLLGQAIMGQRLGLPEVLQKKRDKEKKEKEKNIAQIALQGISSDKVVGSYTAVGSDKGVLSHSFPSVTNSASINSKNEAVASVQGASENSNTLPVDKLEKSEEKKINSNTVSRSYSYSGITNLIADDYNAEARRIVESVLEGYIYKHTEELEEIWSQDKLEEATNLFHIWRLAPNNSEVSKKLDKILDDHHVKFKTFNTKSLSIT